MLKTSLRQVITSYVLWTLFSPPFALATEWRAEPSVSLNGTVDDNLRLRSDDSQVDTAYGSVLEPSVRLSARNPSWDLTATGRLEFERFWGIDGADQNNKYLTLGTNHRFERSTLGFSGAVINDTTLQTGTDPDAGLTTDKVNRLSFAGNGSWNYQLTRRYFLDTGLRARYITYDNGEDEGLFDSYSIRPSASLGYQYSERTRLNLSYRFGYINSDRPDGQTSKTNSLLVGFDRAFTQRLNINLSVGARHTTTDRDIQVIRIINGIPTIVEEPQDDSTTGLTYEGGFAYEFDNGRWGLRATRDVQPSANGVSSDRTGLIFTGNRRWTERFSTGLNASTFINRTVGDTDTRNDRKSFRVSPSVRYRLTRDLSLTGRYTFRRVTRDLSDTNATSNAGFVGLTYQWPRISVSR